MKTRVLFVNEFSCHNSGYAKYGMEVLKRLSQKEDIEIAELACYGSLFSKKDVLQSKDLPWDVFFNIPNLDDPVQKKDYLSKKVNEFGLYSFHKVCSIFKPHVVMDIRDWWMNSYQETSAYRKRFNWAIMTTVDATPQNKQWIYSFCNADAVFTYTDWATEVLRQHAGDNINLLGTASPCAEEYYEPTDTSKAKSDFCLNPNAKIIGTVMRNQGRKLFPDLFASFREFLDRTKRPNVYLYCHTAHPDVTWDIPDLLKTYNIASRTLFTYKCMACGYVFPKFYQGASIICPYCGEAEAKMPRVENGVDDIHMAKIMQCFDLYVQYANSEGFWMPMVEAGMSGIPIVGIDYSAMTDVLGKLESKAIKPVHLATEINSGRLRAIPDNTAFVDYLVEFFSLPIPNRLKIGTTTHLNAKKHYNWDETANKWYEYFKTVDTEYYEAKWKEPIKLVKPAPLTNEMMYQTTTSEYCRWLITKVLCDESQLNGFMHMRLVRDISSGLLATEEPDINYANEQSLGSKKSNMIKFTREMAYNYISALSRIYNKNESERIV